MLTASRSPWEVSLSMILCTLFFGDGDHADDEDDEPDDDDPNGDLADVDDNSARKIKESLLMIFMRGR